VTRDQIPVFINCRDRLEPLIELVDWLERASTQEIHLLDNDSAYPPLLEYYERTPHNVVRLGENYGKWSLWQAPGVRELARGRRFVYTDPDVIPVPECQFDAIDRFGELLDKYKLPNKAGFGLRLDDIPDHYRHKQAVLFAEEGFWHWPLERGVYYAAIDTTFALYRHDSSWAREAIRTGPPYVARHDSWYIDLDNPTAEELFYQERAQSETAHTSGMAHWVADELHAPLAARSGPLLPTLNARIRWRLRGRRAVRVGRR
jgi:hypothetical protein